MNNFKQNKKLTKREIVLIIILAAFLLGIGLIYIFHMKQEKERQQKELNNRLLLRKDIIEYALPYMASTADVDVDLQNSRLVISNMECYSEGYFQYLVLYYNEYNDEEEHDVTKDILREELLLSADLSHSDDLLGQYVNVAIYEKDRIDSPVFECMKMALAIKKGVHIDDVVLSDFSDDEIEEAFNYSIAANDYIVENYGHMLYSEYNYSEYNECWYAEICLIRYIALSAVIPEYDYTQDEEALRNYRKYLIKAALESMYAENDVSVSLVGDEIMFVDSNDDEIVFADITFAEEDLNRMVGNFNIHLDDSDKITVEELKEDLQKSTDINYEPVVLEQFVLMMFVDEEYQCVWGDKYD